MAQLYFRIGSDWDEVLRLREECEKLEKQLLKMDKMKVPEVVAALEAQLASSRQKMNEMLSDAAKAGAALAESTESTESTEDPSKLNTTLKLYQDYAAQRLAIEKKFNDNLVYLYAQRDKAEKEGNGEAMEQTSSAIAQATKDRGKELITFDFKVLKESPEYTRAFEDLKNTSTETLESLLSQLDGMKTKASEVLNPTEFKEYAGTIKNIIGELTSRNPFEALADTQNELVRANAALATATTKLNNAQKTGDTAIVAEAQKEYQKALDDTTKAGNEHTKAQKEVNRQMGELYSALSGVGNAIGGTSGKIISFIADIGKFVSTSIAGIKTVSLAATSTIGAIEKASVIIGIISMAIQLMRALGSLLQGDDNDKLQKQIDRYNALISLYDKLIDKQKEYLKTLTGPEAVKQAEATTSLIARKQEAERKKFEAWFKDHGIVELVIKGSFMGDPFKDLFAKVGITNLYDISQYLKLDASQWRELQSYIELWEVLPEEVQNYGKSVIETDEELKKLGETLDEIVTGVSFDSFRNGFLDTLADMDSSAEDFADNLEKYLQRAILNGMIKKELDDDIKKLYKKYVEFASDGDITKEEADYLKRENDRITNRALARRDELADIFGWDSDTNFSGLSFDSLKGSLDSLVASANLAFGDIQDSFEEHMRQAVLNVIKKNFLDDALLKWYTNLEKAMSDGTLSEEETNRLRAEYENAAMQANEQFKAAMSIAGIDLNGGDDNTLKGAYAKASQESIDLLAGQTSAQRVAIDNILSLMKSMTTVDDVEYLMHLQYLIPIHESLNIIRDLQINGWKEVILIKELSRQVAGNTDEIRRLSAHIADSNSKIAGSSELTATYLQNIEHNGLNVNIPGIGLS